MNLTYTGTPNDDSAIAVTPIDDADDSKLFVGDSDAGFESDQRVEFTSRWNTPVTPLPAVDEQPDDAKVDNQAESHSGSPQKCSVPAVAAAAAMWRVVHSMCDDHREMLGSLLIETAMLRTQMAAIELQLQRQMRSVATPTTVPRTPPRRKPIAVIDLTGDDDE